MQWDDIAKKALAFKISYPDRYSKTDLIRTIQRKEGNSDCYKTAQTNCSQLDCCWRSDCLK